jgi:hypothetical protein
MAQRAASSLLVIVAGLVAGTGCAERPVVEQLPAANFNGPLTPPPPVAPEPVKPQPKVAVVEPKKVTPPPVAAAPAEWTPKGRTNNWRWIVIHHSATPTGGARAFDKMHKAKGWDELGYHFVVGNGTDTGDGAVEVGARWTKQKWGAHAKTADNQYNNFGIGICLVGNFDNERPTRAQMQNLSRLVAHLMKTYKVPAERVIGHGQTKATDCPGKNVHIADVRKMAAQYAGLPDGGGGVAVKAAAGELLTDVRK